MLTRLFSRIKEEKRNIFIFLTIFIMIYVSQETILFGTNASEKTKILGYVIVFILSSTWLLYALKKRTLFPRKAMFIFAVLSVLVFATMLTNLDKDLLKYGYTIMLILWAMSFTTYVGLDKFKKYFSNIMVVLGIFSIIGSIFLLIKDSFFTIFPTIENTAGIRFSHAGIFACIAKIKEYGFRNYSIFREPGVFIIYLLIALLFEIYKEKEINLFKIIVLSFSVMSTLSTAGYLILILIFGSYLFIKNNSKQAMALKVAIVVFTLFAIFIFAQNFNGVFQKLFVDNASRDSRFGSILINIKLLFTEWYRFFTGLGFSKVEDNFSTIAAIMDMPEAHNTNTIFKIFSVYGFIYACIVTVCAIRFWRVDLKGKKKFIIAVAILAFFMCLSNEDIMFNILLYLFVFYPYGRQEDDLLLKKNGIFEINSVPYGSTAKIMNGIAQVAKEKNMYVTTSYGYSYHPIKGLINPYQIGGIADKLYHTYMARFTGKNGCYSRLSTLELLDKIEELQPKVLHLHNIHGWHVNIPLLFNYIKKNNIKTIWTLHDCWAFTGHCPHFQGIGCDKWQTECDNCSLYKDYPTSNKDNSKYMFNKKKEWFLGVKDMTIVTPSEWLKKHVKSSFLKDYPVKVINNGIDLNVYKPAESDFREKYNLIDKKIILGVSLGWNNKKGLDVFKYLAENLNDEYQVVLVGTDENNDKELPQNVISIHRTDTQEDLVKIYSAVDVFVNPTREDNFPTVNIEALACGTPIVTFETGGSPEIIDETCGIVVEKDNIEKLKEVIIDVCENKPFTKEACLKRASIYDKTLKFEEYIELYS